MFDIEDFGEISIETATKKKVMKVSKLYNDICSFIDRIDRTTDLRLVNLLMPKDDIEMLKYIIHEHDSFNDEIKDVVDEKETRKLLDTLYMYSMMGIVISTMVADLPFSPHEQEFVDNVIGNIKSTDHPLYGFYKATDYFALKTLVSHVRPYMNLNWIDVSEITSMLEMFKDMTFHGDISLWDVRKVENMKLMFAYGNIKTDLSKWQLDNVKVMNGMFGRCILDADISNWKMPKAENMELMFFHSDFNGDISKWEFPNVVNMDAMFEGSSFNGDISSWKFPCVTRMDDMFNQSEFNGDISSWEFPVLESAQRMFQESSFNGNIMGWKFPDDCKTDDIFKKAKILPVNRPWSLLTEKGLFNINNESNVQHRRIFGPSFDCNNEAKSREAFTQLYMSNVTHRYRLHRSAYKGVRDEHAS